LRRVWRATPASADRLALWAAQRLYPQFPKEAIAERIPYLRVLPKRLWGPRLAAVFARCGLRLIDEAPWESPSAAKPEHRLLIWRRQ
jgi:trans-aconitate 2-methyltransferase